MRFFGLRPQNDNLFPRLAGEREDLLNKTHIFSYSPIHLFTFKNTLSPTLPQGRETAFTLAEVLITLGIIGVVAAITMPTLITKIQDRQHIAKWKKEYSLISNSIIQLKNNNTEILNSESYGRAEFTSEFLDVINTKISIIDSCDINTCDNEAWKKGKNVIYDWSGIYNVYSLYKPYKGKLGDNGNGIASYSFNQKAFLFKDGAAAYFGGNNSGAWIVVDVNNFTKGPNEFGRDVFAMKVYNNNNIFWIKPMGAEGTFSKNKYGNDCPCGKEQPTPGSSSDIGGGVGGYYGNVSGGCCSAYYFYTK